MKNIISKCACVKFIFLCIVVGNTPVLYAQPSYSTNFSFQLFDDDKQPVTMETFCKEYEIANVFGNKIAHCQDNSRQIITYDEDTKYFTVRIHTIGPRYSFALYHKDIVMALYIPFSRSEQTFFAVEKLKMKHGAYYLDFNTIKDSITIKKHTYYTIPRVRWRKQRRKFNKSKWKGLESMYMN